MKFYTIKTETNINMDLHQVFAFFAHAENLQRLTPPWLNFRILTPQPIEIKQGSIIEYSIKIHHFPVHWRTEISVWQPPFRFVDRQLKGPYKEWIHEHRFERKNSVTLMIDTVKYCLPLGSLGRLAHVIFIRNDVEKIFRYRNEVIRNLFSIQGKKSG